MFSGSEAARLLEVDRKTIMDWSYHFSEYLSEGSKPPKCRQRFYTIASDEILVNLLLLKTKMNWFAKSINRIYDKIERPFQKQI